MSDKTEYSRLLVKRTDNSGTIPTIPTGTTLSTFTDTDTFVGEFFLNTTDDRLWVRTDNGQYEIMMSGNTSGYTQNLAQTLIYGNDTQGNNIMLSTTDSIESYGGLATLQLDKVGLEGVYAQSLDGIGGYSKLTLNKSTDASIEISDGATNYSQTINSPVFINTQVASSTDDTFIDMNKDSITITQTNNTNNVISEFILDPAFLASVNGTSIQTREISTGNFGSTFYTPLSVNNTVSNLSTGDYVEETLTDTTYQLSLINGANGTDISMTPTDYVLTTTDGVNTVQLNINTTSVQLTGIPSFADDTDAGTGGLTTGEIYQTDGTGASPLNVAGILMIKQ